MLGTLANTAAIIAGSAIGLMVHSRLPRRLVDIVFQGMGLVTLAIGIDMAVDTRNLLLVVVSLIVGGVAGELIGIEKGIARISDRLQAGGHAGGRTTAEEAGAVSRRFNEGFMTATMLFCVGSMAILGSIEDGMGRTPVLLYTKSIMDGVNAVLLAASFGIGVMFSAMSILLYQGALTLLASFIMRYMSDSMIADMTGTGGILLIGLGLSILKVKDIRVANMLPSLAIVVVLSYFFG